MPIAIFRFKYRSKEALKDLLILERTPEPEPEPTPEPAFLQALDPNRRREAEQCIGQLKAGVKRERDTDGVVITGSKRVRSGERVINDLTDD